MVSFYKGHKIETYMLKWYMVFVTAPLNLRGTSLKCNTCMQLKPQHSWCWFRLACWHPVLIGSPWGHWKWSLFNTSRQSSPGCNASFALAELKQTHYTPRNLNAAHWGSQLLITRVVDHLRISKILGCKSKYGMQNVRVKMFVFRIRYSYIT